jgi:hypothetical protein
MSKCKEGWWKEDAPMRPLLLDALNHSSVTTPKWQQRVREATPPHEGNSNIKAESLLEE